MITISPMDVSDLRQRILRALDQSRSESPKRPEDAANRRAELDAAKRAYDGFLANIAVPLLKQAQAILKAEGRLFSVHSPADSARLISDASPTTFLEFVLESSGPRPQVVGRISHGRKRITVEERPLADGKAVQDIGEDDVAAFLVAEIPRLVS